MGAGLYDFWIWYFWGPFWGVLFWGNFLFFEIFENGFGMRMCDFGWVNLVRFIHLKAPYMIFRFLAVFGGPFLGNFWVLEIFKNSFGMRICNFRGIFSEIYLYESS